ncbi:hypothetical protein J8I26_14650 [Herbaspirillum sp. LeCh32-8]|uniref:hypothetical protein n=1 Tax=Herbaspirillum sp. LeCh32-8 TaxID=2821356 RepID=UPI001AE8258A|nr:hypothetical protein [Herbaspirillum sp. LeCh32-8]MBP0599356.1 hypothetical protein [Herbaspirillum sp. LeCh32-8]
MPLAGLRRQQLHGATTATLFRFACAPLLAHCYDIFTVPPHMKRPLAALTLLAAPWLCAQTPEPQTFNGYDAFYASLPHRLFSGDGDQINVSPAHSIRIEGKQYQFKHALAFPGESVYPEDLGRTATLYRSAGHYCVEGIGATSGTGSRHMSVYLIARKDGRIYKLPSLFGSCLGVGRDPDGSIHFLQAKIVNYRAAYDADGVSFDGHTLAHDRFSATPLRLEVRFVEPGNFYRFRQVK